MPVLLSIVSAVSHQPLNGGAGEMEVFAQTEFAVSGFIANIISSLPKTCSLFANYSFVWDSISVISPFFRPRFSHTSNVRSCFHVSSIYGALLEAPFKLMSSP